MKTHYQLKKQAIENLPEGMVFLGKGGSFKTEGDFFGAIIEGFSEDRWTVMDDLTGESNLCLYAAPKYSKTAKLNALGDLTDVAPPKDPATETICEEALRIQGGSRQQDYGDPTPNHEDIAGLWNVYMDIAFKQSGTNKLAARDVAQMMILMKIARNCHKPKRDNWVDMAGYAQCGGKIDKL